MKKTLRKKLPALFMLVLLSFSIAACGNKEQFNLDTTDTDPTTEENVPTDDGSDTADDTSDDSGDDTSDEGDSDGSDDSGDDTSDDGGESDDGDSDSSDDSGSDDSDDGDSDGSDDSGSEDDDTDDDGILDEDDNCVSVANDDQADQDGDGIGDACDSDVDGDGYDSEDSDGEDCDDEDSTINPDATEILNFIDDDCDGSIDNGITLSSATSIMGENREDKLGYQVIDAGDVNYDGYTDILISAPYNDDNASNAGKIYLIFGAEEAIDNFDITNASVVFYGENSGDKAGYTITSAGDINGDKYADIVIATKYNDDNGSSSGKVYIIYGQSFESITEVNLADADVQIKGASSYDYLGTSISTLDLNGDGYSDLLIGAPGSDGSVSNNGKSYLFYGSSSLSSIIDLSTDSADATFTGEANGGDYSGKAVKLLSDINNDGYNDVMITALYNDDAASNAGKVYIIYGSETDFTGDTDLSSASVTYTGEDTNHYAGYTLDGGKDLNNDGINDIVIGAQNADAGKIYIIYGSDSLSSDSLANANVIISGETAGDQAGYQILVTEDLNGDDIADLVISANRYDETDSNIGKIYFITGSEDFESSIELANIETTIIGDSENSYAGSSISIVDDLDGDDNPELLVGASSFDNGSSYPDIGKVYLISIE